MTENEELYYEQLQGKERNAAMEEKYAISQKREEKKSKEKTPVWNDKVELVSKLKKIRRAYKKQILEAEEAEVKEDMEEYEAEKSAEFFLDNAVKEYIL